jgi:hypothetical protein
VLSNIGIFLALSVAALALLDVLLSDIQKNWVANRALDFWSWLHMNTGISYMRELAIFE